jgi:hypothetical protein
MPTAELTVKAQTSPARAAGVMMDEVTKVRTARAESFIDDLSAALDVRDPRCRQRLPNV